jgi:hypothetical protein
MIKEWEGTSRSVFTQRAEREQDLVEFKLREIRKQAANPVFHERIKHIED